MFLDRKCIVHLQTTQATTTITILIIMLLKAERRSNTKTTPARQTILPAMPETLGMQYSNS